MNKIRPEEIITCKSYIPLCDYIYDAPNLDDIPPTGLVHVPLDQIEEFFSRIDSNGHRYVVVSSCSDYGLAIQQDQPAWKDMLKWLKMQIGPPLGYNDVRMPARVDKSKCNMSDKYSIKCHSWTRATIPSIPNNVHHWFVVNLMLTPNNKNITAIPFGVAEGKQEGIYEEIESKINEKPKDNKIYISWNDYTYERYKLREKMTDWQKKLGAEPLTVKVPGEPDPYDKYLKALSTHKYCISPPGNGADCYRTLESIYMGCLTLVENTPLNLSTGLPVLTYKNVDDIISYYEDNVFDQMAEDFALNTPQIKLPYWKEIIHSKRSELF